LTKGKRPGTDHRLPVFADSVKEFPRTVFCKFIDVPARSKASLRSKTKPPVHEMKERIKDGAGP